MTDRMQIINGDALEELRRLDSDSLDSSVTDPPYLIDFMGQKFDSQHRSLEGRSVGRKMQRWHEAWAKEAYRVLKPGAFLAAFGGDRTFHRLACAIEDVDFELRTTIVWNYSTGFPKSLDVGEGRGTALKPAAEFIVLARKPMSEKTVVANVERWGTGALNIDACRIGSNHWTKKDGKHSGSEGGHLQQIAKREAGKVRESRKGRWPANFILSHSLFCNGSCVEGCPVALLDQQSGESESKQRTGQRAGKEHGRYGAFKGQDEVVLGHFDSGGASRFFFIAEWNHETDVVPFIHCAKASKAERDRGLEDAPDVIKNRVNPGGIEHDPRWAPIQVKNNHPTLKPVSLLAYLCRLITPPSGTVLDCFAGSGSTGVAAQREGFNFIGIEKEPAYVEIAQRRIQGRILPLFDSSDEEQAAVNS